MRGKANLMFRVLRVKGITPAYAGKSQIASNPRRSGRDHPRVCGEKQCVCRFLLSAVGSPPRMRGKGVNPCNQRVAVRITPACAGKSCSGCCSCSCAGDHPRVCGEKSKEVAEYASKAGSPPRVRGKVEPFKGSMYQSRITPACAGKRIAAPRGHQAATGSPPRVRGKVDAYIAHMSQPGITPACAGKRLKRSHSIGHFSCILCLFHSVLHRASVSGGSRAGPCAPPCLPAQNAVPV